MKMTNNTKNILTAPNYQQEISKIIRSNLSPALIEKELLDYHEKDIAATLDILRKDERSKLYSILSADVLADVLEYCEHPEDFINEINHTKLAQVLEYIQLSDAVEYLQYLDNSKREHIANLLSDELKSELKLSRSFSKDEIGSKMSTNYISITENSTVKQAMKELVSQAEENDNISTMYVTDKNNCFVGAIDLKDLIIAREYTPLDDIIMTSYPYVYANEEIDSCIERIKDYSEDSIPVLDEKNQLIGVLIARDIIQISDEAFDEDYAMLAGLSAHEDLQEPVKDSLKKRLPWLIILLGLGMVVSAVVGMFEAVVANLAIVVCFQSLVLDMAGNVGTQSLAVTIRVLTDKTISEKQKLFLIFKEGRIGLINGLILGSMSFIFIGLYLVFIKSQTYVIAFSVSACTGAALILSMLLSGIAGTAIPIIFKKLNIDPAVASGPLITTVNDLVAVISYYGLAWLFIVNVIKL